jgi:hypothetical protein
MRKLLKMVRQKMIQEGKRIDRDRKEPEENS